MSALLHIRSPFHDFLNSDYRLIDDLGDEAEFVQDAHGKHVLYTNINQERHAGTFGNLNLGVVFLAADAACGAGAYLLVEEHEMAVTASLNVTCEGTTPLNDGRKLIAYPLRPERVDKGRIHADAVIRDTKGNLVAKAQSIFVAKPVHELRDRVLALQEQCPAQPASVTPSYSFDNPYQKYVDIRYEKLNGVFQRVVATPDHRHTNGLPLDKNTTIVHGAYTGAMLIPDAVLNALIQFSRENPRNNRLHINRIDVDFNLPMLAGRRYHTQHEWAHNKDDRLFPGVVSGSRLVYTPQDGPDMHVASVEVHGRMAPIPQAA